MRLARAYYGNRPAVGAYLGTHPIPLSGGPRPQLPLWTYVDAWAGYGSSGFAVATGPTGSPLTAGTVLVAAVATRPNDREQPVEQFAITDDIGSQWTLAGMATEAGSSTAAAIFVNPDAEGVSAVQVGAPDSGTTHLHVLELTGPTGHDVAVAGDGAVRPDGTTWAPVEVTAPAGSVIIGAASLGVTNRGISVHDPYVLMGEHKQSQVHSLVAGRPLTEPATTGPEWDHQSGTSAGLVTVTAALSPAM